MKSIVLQTRVMVFFCLITASSAFAQTLIYNNSIYEGLFYLGNDIIFDYGTSQGGLVKKIAFGYSNPMHPAAWVRITFYSYPNLNTYDEGYFISSITINNLPDTYSSVFQVYEHVLTGNERFELPNGRFGFTMEVSNDDTELALAWGGSGQADQMWLWSGFYWQPFWFGGDPWAGFYMKIYTAPPDNDVTCDIYGKKYNDLNQNKSRDAGEPAIRGWDIYLDINNNGICEESEPNVVTDPNGSYLFDNVPSPATYTIREVMKNGWTQTQPGPSSQNQYIVITEPNHVFGPYDFGNTDKPVVQEITISGYVQETGVPISNVYVEAYQNGATPTGRTDTTDAQGYYSIQLPNPWTGKLVVQKKGYLFDATTYYTNRTTNIAENINGAFLYGGGNGSQSSPFEIWTARQLNNIGRNSYDWDQHFILMTDIDMSDYTGTQYNIIGNNTTKFVGVFDGNGYIISHLTYSTTSAVNYIGLFGAADHAAIRNLGLEDVLFSSGGNYIGGIGGFLSYSALTACYATGSVSGGANVGGLLGSGNNNTITSCYAKNSINTGSNGGGLAGAVTSNTITSCYSAGLVSGAAASVGGLFGIATGNTINGCFWDTQTSGKTASAGGTGKTTAQMKTLSTFTNAAWDFVNTWRMCDGTNYPRLQWEPKPVGDFVCPDGVEDADLMVFSEEWLAAITAADFAPEGGDGRFDLLELEALSKVWLSSSGQPGWNSACDLYPQLGDGIIDGQDLAVFIELWLSRNIRYADIAPLGAPDGKVDLMDYTILAQNWLVGVD